MSTFIDDAKLAHGAWLNREPEHILAIINSINETFCYSDLVGIFPSDHDDRHCWTLVFVGEGNEGVMTIEVGTHEGVFFVKEPEIHRHFTREVREAFRELRDGYEHLWSKVASNLRARARVLDHLSGREPR